MNKKKVLKFLFPKLGKKHWAYRLLTVIFVGAFLGVLSLGSFWVVDDWSPFSKEIPVFEFQPGFSKLRGVPVKCLDTKNPYYFGLNCGDQRADYPDRRQVVKDYMISVGTDPAENNDGKIYVNKADGYIQYILGINSGSDLNNDGVINGYDVSFAYDNLNITRPNFSVSEVFEKLMEDNLAIITKQWYWDDIGAAGRWLSVVFLGSLVAFWLVYRLFVYIVSNK